MLRLELRQACAQQLEHALHSARGARRYCLALGVPHHKTQAPEYLRQRRRHVSHAQSCGRRARELPLRQRQRGALLGVDCHSACHVRGSNRMLPNCMAACRGPHLTSSPSGSTSTSCTAFAPDRWRSWTPRNARVGTSIMCIRRYVRAPTIDPISSRARQPIVASMQMRCCKHCRACSCAAPPGAAERFSRSPPPVLWQDTGFFRRNVAQLS